MEEINTIYNEEYEDNQLKVPYLCTSALNGTNIVKAFDKLGELLIMYQNQKTREIIPVDKSSSPSLRSKL